ncbi:MAG TPA: hypothetical protein PLO37_05075 [Candidatus Hydrogenedentes bacterium]|nr:hypothetical protein [Candidatus Hydrogenedentota bacterium]HPG66198.1 hypothetical protein [Candidatus Hydrogenedentota bacterium]
MSKKKVAEKEARPRKSGQSGVLIAVLAGGLVAAMAVFVPLGPYKDYKESQRKVSQLRSQEQLAMLTLVEEQENVARQQELMSRIEAREASFDLKGFMSRVIREAGLAERSDLQNIKPSSRFADSADSISMVQLKLKGVRLIELVDFLHEVYASNNVVVVHKLDTLQADNSEKGLNANITFISPKG